MSPCAINDVDRGWPAIADARSLGLRVLTFGNSAFAEPVSRQQILRELLTIVWLHRLFAVYVVPLFRPPVQNVGAGHD